MNMETKVVSFTIVLYTLLLAIPAFAYDNPVQYNNVYIRSYGVNTSKCIEVMDKIPEKYFRELHTISLFDKPMKVAGLYFESKVIHIYTGCEDQDYFKEVLIHELAHHCQKMLRNTLYQKMNHLGDFDECEDMIWEEYDER